METWAYFKSYFRPMIRVKLRRRFDETKADELTEEILKVVLGKLEQGEPKDSTRLESYVVGMCEIMARQTIREAK